MSQWPTQGEAKRNCQLTTGEAGRAARPNGRLARGDEAISSEAGAEGDAARHLAAGLALAAGLLHFQVAPHHFAEAFPFGLFMVAAGAVQVAAGLLLLAWPSRALLHGLRLGTILLLGLYAAAHTTGVPFGPYPWQPEHVHPIDLVSKGTEVSLLLVLGRLSAAHQKARVAALAMQRLLPLPKQ